jgi:pimeloyl-ACP methyl ester carboxylesterase
VDRLVAAQQIPSGPFDVMGYHTGSVIAGVMARLAPMRVRRIVLVSLPAYSAALRLEKMEQLAQFPVPVEDGSHLTGMWNLVTFLSDPRSDAEWRNASVTENLRCGGRATWGYQAVFALDFQATLAALDQPVMVINAQDDLWQQTHENVGLIADCRHVELPGIQHGLFLLERDRIAELVREFLDNT